MTFDTKETTFKWNGPYFTAHNLDVDKSLTELYRIINVRDDVEKIIKYIQHLERYVYDGEI